MEAVRGFCTGILNGGAGRREGFVMSRGTGGFDYGGFISIRDQVMAMERGFHTWLEKFLLKQAQSALEQIKGNSSADSGSLLGEWYVGKIKRVGNRIEVSIKNDMEYASSVEYGHMNSSRTGWVDGSFQCTFAVNEIQRELPVRFSREFAAWVRSLGAEIR